MSLAGTQQRVKAPLDVAAIRAQFPGTSTRKAVRTASLTRAESRSRHCALWSTRSDIIRSTSTDCVWMVLCARR